MPRVLSRPRSTLLLAILISLTMLTLNLRGGSSFSFGGVKSGIRDTVFPVRSGLDKVLRPIANTITGAFDYSALKSENAKLKEQLQKLQGKSNSFSATQQELAGLLAVEHIPFVGSINGVNGEVIAFSPTNLQLTFEVDRGISNGVRVGNPVVAGVGLAGRVVAVSKSTATVLMLSDPSFSTGVRFGKSGNIALAVGQGAGDYLKVSLVDPGTPVHKAEVFSTSGLQGEIFPAGIPVARLVAVSTPPGALQESIRAAPLVNYDTLQFVRILLWQPSAALP